MKRSPALIIWAVLPSRSVPFSSFRKQYWLTLLIFIFLHRVEEYFLKFQEELSKITGTPIPDVKSPSLILLVLLSVGAWLLIPYLFKRNYEFGYYLAWTFFAAMGITELAHFIFPLFMPEPYGFFPGMASVILLAPAAWWEMYRLVNQKSLRFATPN